MSIPIEENDPTRVYLYWSTEFKELPEPDERIGVINDGDQVLLFCESRLQQNIFFCHNGSEGIRLSKLENVSGETVIFSQFNGVNQIDSDVLARGKRKIISELNKKQILYPSDILRRNFLVFVRGKGRHFRLQDPNGISDPAQSFGWITYSPYSEKRVMTLKDLRWESSVHQIVHIAASCEICYESVPTLPTPPPHWWKLVKPQSTLGAINFSLPENLSGFKKQVLKS